MDEVHCKIGLKMTSLMVKNNGGNMQKSRLEAFSDGVIAIIITIMVLELKVPHGTTWNDLSQLQFVFLSYVISFVYVAIYWNNHHHLIHAVKHVNGAIMWANIHLLFWLSLIPFVTAWAGENHFAPIPTVLYGLDLFMAAIAFYILVRALIAQEGMNSPLAKAIGSDMKGKVSVVLNGIAIPLAFFAPLVAVGLYTLVAAIWFIPDKRIEKHLPIHKD